MFKSIIEKEIAAFESLKSKLGFENATQTPKIEKIIVSTGVGSITDKKKLELIPQRIAMITGQKPSPQLAKKSIAQFKVREGDLAGFRVTLRGKMATAFLDKLIHIALPRTRDFRGLSTDGVDEMGNYSFGIKESTIFPEIADEELKNVFGMSVTIVTSSKDKKHTIAFLEYLGLPFKK
jgi:large subunit ribosomal protein L5